MGANEKQGKNTEEAKHCSSNEDETGIMLH
jgi:hypothetical protein